VCPSRTGRPGNSRSRSSRPASSRASRRGTSRVFLKEAALRPHKSRYRLNPKIDDPVEHAKQVATVCDVYHQAPALEAAGVHVVSVDEKTSIQALERAAPTKPMKPGLDERREFEYKRHGTLCLIANLVVATGKIVAPTLGPTRDEQDFARHIDQTIATDPSAGWIFVADNLTTHCSESMVRLVAKHEGLELDLKKKGKIGILLDVESRRRFLSDESHRIRFVFTPKHCSWLNQVEIWFGILVRRALKRASFETLDALRAAIEAFIGYFNETLAKPFRWTYSGRPLAV
jgi:transposase